MAFSAQSDPLPSLERVLIVCLDQVREAGSWGICSNHWLATYWLNDCGKITYSIWLCYLCFVLFCFCFTKPMALTHVLKKSLPKDMFIDLRERGRGVGRERNISVREKHPSGASHTCHAQGLNLQPRYVPWRGTEPTTFCCTGWCSNQLSHLARAAFNTF